MTTAPTPRPTRSPSWLLVPLAGFAVVSRLAGFLAEAEIDRGGGYFDLFFSDTIHLKVWLASAAGGLLFAVLIAVWYTSAVWFFRLVGVGL